MSALRAAATQLDLQPVVGALLTGFATRLEPSTGCHDALLAKVLLMDDGATRLAWVACDLIGFSVADSFELRRLIGGRLGMSPANVLVSCTHTHSGPSSMPFRGDLARVDRPWLERIFRAIADAAATLPARLRRARLTCATEPVPGLGYNRQDGVCPIDERLVVAQLRGVDDAADGGVIATLLNYATHPVVLGEQNLQFSADYPGYATRTLEHRFGGVAMFVLGAAGDVDPAIYRDAGRHAGTFDVAESMGQALADAAARALANAREARTDIRIAVAESQVDLPLDPPPPPDELARLKTQLLARRGSPDVIPPTNEGKWAIFELAWVEDLERTMRRGGVPRTIRANITALRVGDLRVVACPFELYARIGLEIRRHFAPHPVLVAGYTNGLIGYLATDAAKDQGGYGPASSHRFFPELLTALGYGADAAIIRAATELLP